MKQFQEKLDACEENQNLKLQVNVLTEGVAEFKSENAELKADIPSLKAANAELQEFMRVYLAKVCLLRFRNFSNLKPNLNSLSRTLSDAR